MVVMSWFAAVILAAPGARPVALEMDTASESDPFQWSVSVPELTVGTKATAALSLPVPDGFRVYRDTLSVRSAERGTLNFGRPELPRGVKLETKAGVREAYDMDVVVHIPVTASEAGLGRGTLVVEWQACHQGLCLPARSEEIEVFAPVR